MKASEKKAFAAVLTADYNRIGDEGDKMRRLMLICAVLASPALARPGYHNNGFATGVIVGAALAGPPVPFIINTGPVASLVPSGAPMSAQGAMPVADEIAKMAALRDKGILTEPEFQQQKEKLLGGPQ